MRQKTVLLSDEENNFSEKQENNLESDIKKTKIESQKQTDLVGKKNQLKNNMSDHKKTVHYNREPESITDDSRQTIIEKSQNDEINSSSRKPELIQNRSNLIGLSIGNFKIEEEIASGGMGTVYKAKHQTLESYAAIKSLKSEFSNYATLRDALEAEAKNQAKIKHPNTIQINDFEEVDGNFYLIMEYVDGIDMENKIQSGFKDELEILIYMKQILAGLNYAHSKRIVHRDIKPSNIIIDSHNRARIMDFGIAMIVGSESHESGIYAYTPEYASPEQIALSDNIDHRCDVYSSGILLYEMLTKRLPFNCSDPECFKKAKSEQPPITIQSIVSNIHPTLANIVMKAIERYPDKRYSNCGEFLHDLESYEEQAYVKCPKCKSLNKVQDSSQLKGLKCQSCGNKLASYKMPWKWLTVFFMLGLLFSGFFVSNHWMKVSYYKADILSQSMLERDRLKWKAYMAGKIPDPELVESFTNQAQHIVQKMINTMEEINNIPNYFVNKSINRYIDDKNISEPKLAKSMEKVKSFFPVCFVNGDLIVASCKDALFNADYSNINQ